MTSAKKEKLLSDIDTEINIGRQGLRKRDLELISFDAKRIRKWTPNIQKQWLQSVNILRQRADQPLKRKFEEKEETQTELYKIRSANLKKYSTPLFHRWQMKTHNETAKWYVQSTAQLKAQLKADGLTVG